MKQVAIVGAGVSGLTCGVCFAERGLPVTIFAETIGPKTTSAAAAALWFPYDVEPLDKVIPWALETYEVLVDLSNDPLSGALMTELRQFSRSHEIQIPEWAYSLGARRLSGRLGEDLSGFHDGFAINVPLTDTTIYLDYLTRRFLKAGGRIQSGVRFERLEDVDATFGFVINCAGVGARELVNDAELEPHRGQVAIVPKIDNLRYAIVSDDAPLMYAIPRRNDCVFGGTNELSDSLDIDKASTSRIVAECSRVLGIAAPIVIAERVGLRPFRKSGVRLQRDVTPDGRTVVHNYGHGGSGFTLSWGCAHEVVDLTA